MSSYIILRPPGTILVTVFTKPNNLTDDPLILKLLIINRSLANRWCNKTSHIANKHVCFFYLNLHKYFDSDHMCYIYIASYSSPADLSPESLSLVRIWLPFNLVQKICTKCNKFKVHSNIIFIFIEPLK